jgi:hypothetical protein
MAKTGNILTTSHSPDAAPHFVKVARASIVDITGNLERPVAEEVFVLHWEDADIVIPWPKGMTAKQAIIDWSMDAYPSWIQGR